MIRIEGSANTARIEETLQKITSTSDEALQIPVKPQEWWLGGEQSLIELLITWARITSRPTLHTHIKADEDPGLQLEKMAKRMFGFVALMMAAEIRDRDNTNRSLRESAYDQCRQIVEKMHNPIMDFDLGPKIYLISVDHSTKAYIPWLYGHDRSVKNRESFESLSRDLFRKLNKYKRIPQEPAPQIGAILHELFKNTHEWAQTDWNNVPWRRSVRGLSAEVHVWDIDKLKGIANDNPALEQYFDGIRDTSSRDQLAFIELTVFDSGIGLARRWLKRPTFDDLPLDKEYDACMQCLTKHQTSSSQHEKGVGLAEVMQTMSSVDGFLKIRSGRLSMYRDFIKDPFNEHNVEVRLNDFPTCTSEMTRLAPVYGTHYQLLIPLYS